MKFEEKLIIAGPCTFGSYEELYKIALEVKKRGIKYLRAGTFKMRTNPKSFQGLRESGMEMLLKIKKELGLKIVTELTSIEQVKKYGNEIDIIQIGARNMYNYELLKELSKDDSIFILSSLRFIILNTSDFNSNISIFSILFLSASSLSFSKFFLLP